MTAQMNVLAKRRSLHTNKADNRWLAFGLRVDASQLFL